MTKLDAIVLTDDALSLVKIAGLSARERAIRVANQVGAERVFVVEDGNREALSAWRAPTSGPVIVIRADQLVHHGLVTPLVESKPHNGIASAVDSGDRYAGALIATGAAADAVVERLARGESDTSIARDAEIHVPHGAVACHPIATAAQLRDAHTLLYSVLIKPQDNGLTRYVYRPISIPLTKLLVWTRVSPNQLSILVGIVVGSVVTSPRSPT